MTGAHPSDRSDPSAAATPSDPSESDDAAERRGPSEPLLAVRNLTTVFHTDAGSVRAVDGVSFDVYAGETVGIVGESGAGKSVTARSIMGLVDPPGELLDTSSIRFAGEELTTYTDRQYRALRGSGIAIVPQDPQESLNPVYTVGNQIQEAVEANRDLAGTAARDLAVDLLEAVAIPDAARRFDDYPHEFSGGMRQRAVIAMMLACDPDLLICDEPTTALDVTIQAQILDLLDEIQDDRDLAMVFITHDMGVIARMADRVNVMYAGEFVETAGVETLFAEPRHPYTRGLLDAIPGRADPGAEEPFRPIEGDVPTPTGPADQCRFAPRCPEAFDACRRVAPRHVPVDGEPTHTAACLLYPAGASESKRVAFARGEREPDAADRRADDRTE
jgi:peptide/nickel transport system ATP-binding protein